MLLLKWSWLWLTTCAENGCANHPVHLGWCSDHAPAYNPPPDEYWADPAGSNFGPALS